MTRKPMLLTAFISLLVILMLSGICFVNLGRGDPFAFRVMDEVPPDDKTEPPTILILSPENNTSYAANNVVLSLDVRVGYSATAANPPAPYLLEIYYKTDWQRDLTYIYKFGPETGSSLLSRFNTTINLKGIPEGNHKLTVYAVERGRYEKNVPDNSSRGGFLIESYPFKITGSSSTHFAVDATPPSVLILSVENGTLDASDVHVDFFVNEPVQQVSYVLDEQENVTVSGNVTLSGLPSGVHSLTVYATDEAGNVGASETINLTVASQPTPSPSPSPSLSPSPSPSASASDHQPASSLNSQSAASSMEIAYASMATATVVALIAVAVVYLRRRRQSTQTTAA